jgi:hypothetical protein
MRGQPDDFGIALRGFGGALLGAGLGFVTVFTAAAPLAVVCFLIGPGLGWGLAVGGPTLMWRSAVATAVTCLGAAAAAAGLGFMALMALPPQQSHLGPLRWDMVFVFGIVGILPGALAGRMWAEMLRWKQGRSKSAVAAAIAGFVAPGLLTILLWPSEATQNRNSGGFYGDLSLLGVILGLLILSPPVAFILSSTFLSPGFAAANPWDNHGA